MELGNYKINVTTEAESKEAQELFFELGYYWNTGLGVKNFCAKFLYVKNSKITMGFCSDNFSDSNYCELTLPQLRDLVVLHRNDVNDATYKKDNGSMYGYLCCDGTEYTWNFSKNIWFESIICFSDSDIKPINKELISGADALRALADGKEVEYFSNADYTWKSIFKYHPSLEIIATKELDINHKFRLKPRTITLNIEIPAPFEPKRGEMYWFIDSSNDEGYTCVTFNNDVDDKRYVSFGAWRTEEEIKQVVAALRGALKNG